MLAVMTTPMWGVRSFVHFLLAGVQPTLDPNTEICLYIGSMRQPRERRIFDRCVRWICTLCRVKEGTVGVSSLSGISKRAPSRRGLLIG